MQSSIFLKSYTLLCNTWLTYLPTPLYYKKDQCAWAKYILHFELNEQFFDRGLVKRWKRSTHSGFFCSCTSGFTGFIQYGTVSLWAHSITFSQYRLRWCGCVWVLYLWTCDLIWNWQKWENFYITCVLSLDVGSRKSFGQAPSHILVTKIREILEKKKTELNKKKKSFQPSATQYLPHLY